MTKVTFKRIELLSWVKMFAAEIGQDVCETGDIKNCASLKPNAEITAYKWH